MYGCIVARMFQGGGDITVQTVAYSALTNTFFESKEVYLGYGEAAAGLGLMIGPIIGGAVNSWFGYFTCYIFICILICLDIVFTIFVMPPDSQNEIAIQNIDQTEEEKKKKEEESSDTKVPYSWFLVNRRASFAMITVGMTMLLASFKSSFMTPYLKKRGYEEDTHGWIIGIPSMFYVISCNIVGRIVDKAPRRIFLVVSLVAMTVSGFFLGPSQMLGLPDSVPLLLAATCANAIA